jgi:4-hydroxybenzoyl-CoA reductase subunit beta
MKLPKFMYKEPHSIEEASSLALQEPSAKILAGGTDLLVNMKHRAEVPTAVINIKKIPGMAYIREENGIMRIGALTTLKTIADSVVIAEKLPALSHAASSVGSCHHQNMGTVGGNLCQQTRCKYFNQSKWWRSARPLCFKAGGGMCYVSNSPNTCYATYCGDVAPALLVMNAEVVLTTQGASRRVPLESIFSGAGKTPLNLEKGEILTEILIPGEAAQGFSTYKKSADRKSIDFPIVGAALWRSHSTGESRIALTAVHRKPVRTLRLEDSLRGRQLHDLIIEAADRLVAKETQLMTSSIESLSYKRKLIGMLVRDALGEAARSQLQ